MKTYLWLFCTFLLCMSYANDEPGITITDDPITFSKQIIAEEPNPWISDTRSSVLTAFGSSAKLGTNDDKYILLESPGLAFDYFQGGYANLGDNISKGLLLEMLSQALNSPETVISKLAKASINKGLSEYQAAFSIAENYKETNELSLEESLKFLENRYGYSKLNHVRKLMESNTSQQKSAVEEKNKKKVLAKLREIEKKYPDQIAWVDALPLLEEWYRLLEEGQVGLAAYEPYIDFKKSMDQLNQSRINDRINFRSGLKITYPDASTVWTQPGPVDIKWESFNIAKDKPVRFFLVKDDMVVQDMGTYKNSEYQDGIKIRKGLPTGSNYRIMGIEQMPSNRYHVAKFATPFFTIEKAPRKTEKAIAVATKTSTSIQPAVPTIKATEELKPIREKFAGRTISYVKELVVDSDQIQIILWDHGRQDGDLVSIYLNGDEVIKKHLLTYREVLFEIKLDPSQKNDLFLYAHNLGKFPPNTVSIKIKDNSNTEEIVLNSDLKSCESVLINVKQ
ncbi:MAG: hypothetical protein ACR2MM_04780 [Flavobacteriaceae bacterium]